MLNHTYTSVKNANLVDCGRKQHIPSQPFPLLRDNFLGEYRTELDKKKVLANLGIATDLSLEWEYIKGDIGRSEALMGELDSRTKYTSKIDGFYKTVIEGIEYLETVVGGEQEGEEEQNDRLTALEQSSKELGDSLNTLKTYITETVDVNIETLQENLNTVTEKVNNITNLIQVSTKANNALILIPEGSEDLQEGETPGLYVPDLSEEVSTATQNIEKLQEDVQDILDTYVTKEELGGGDFDFVSQDDFDTYVDNTEDTISDIQEELAKTVKTGEDGHVDTLYVNKISKNNDDGNIVITDSFEVDSDIPLDIRFVRENLEELYALPVKVCYPGMGVIVNSLSSLYILRKPAEGIQLTQEYIANPNNWKCPEDLVTVALTRQAYEELEEINPNVFYYIYEDEITRTQEPKRNEFLTDEEFEQAFQQWVDSLKILSQEYMSASWGVDIENKLAKKASSQSVSLLISEINNIKGNGNNPSLESLNISIQELQTKDEQFKERIDEILIKHDDIEQGRLIDVEKEVSKVKEDLSNYVTKDYIQDSSNDFIFVKNSEYQQDQNEFKESLASKVETEEVVTNTVTLQGKAITIQEDRLTVDSKVIAEVNDIPVIEVLPQKEYDDLEKAGNVKEETYYYTYDGEVRLVTSTDLSKETARLQQQINVLFQGGTAEDIESTLEVIFLPIETWNAFQQEYQQITTLVKDLEQRLLKLEPLKVVTSGDTIYVSGDPERCYYEGDTVYIESDLITY